MALIDTSETYQMTNPGDHIDGTDVYQSNRNLLDNPWFTVNQRNFTSSKGVNNIYSVDRWYIARGTGTISKTNNGITINGVGASRETTFQQMIDCGDLTGRTVALSVNDGGTIRQITGTVPARTTSNNIFIRFALRDGVSAFLYAMATSSAYAYMLQFQVNAGYTIDLRAVKLELGSVSTLANDVPPDYGEELAKCQRYFLRINAETAYGVIGTAYISAANNALMLLNINMIARPTTVTTSGTFRIMANGTSYSGVVLTADKDVSNSRVLRFSCYRSAAGLTVGQVALVTADNNAASYIDISADL